MLHKLFMALVMASFFASAESSDSILVTVDPGHFHAALVQKEMLPGISQTAYVYAPLGTDLTAHLNRIALFNARPQNPTNWAMRVYAGPDFFEKMLAERPGKLAVLSGRNQGKIARISSIAAAGMHVLADKPWVIESEDLPALDAALRLAREKGIVAYDGMTQRFEITCLLQKELVRDAGVFGKPLAGTEAEPSVYMESVHYMFKQVAGVPNLRPAWFFDIRQQGEGLTDVGTHLVDLVQWTLFPEQMLDPERDIRVTAGKRWPTVITKADFQRVTGERQFPEYLSQWVKDDSLAYYCNNSVDYTLRGIRVRLDVKWGYEAQPGAGDTELAIYRGTNASVEVHQGKAENFKPEVYVVPASGKQQAVRTALIAKLRALEGRYPGLDLEDQGGRLHVVIPERYRIGHEAHFALLLKTFLDYTKSPGSVPAWEDAFMRAKYFVTTKGVQVARSH